MSSIAGQAARHTGRLVHWLLQLALALVVAAAAGLGVLGWRLSAGPLELPWLARQLQAVANADSSTKIGIASAALAWEGFRSGTDQPLDIRVIGLTITSASGTRLASIPRADVALSLGRLALGQLVPRSIVVMGARLRVIRATDGGVTLDLGTLTEPGDASPGATTEGGLPARLLGELVQPASSDQGPRRASRWSQLQRLRIQQAAIRVIDRQLGLAWQVPDLDIAILRQPQGGLLGQGAATIELAGQSARLDATAILDPDTRQTRIAASLAAVNPARLARAIPAAKALAALDAPVALSGTVMLAADLHPDGATARAEIGAGTMFVASGHAPLQGAVVTAGLTPDRAQVTLLRLDMAPHPDGPVTTVQGRATLARGGRSLQAEVALDLDRVAFADLAALWPEGVGGNGTRPWITQNITAGEALGGHVEAALDVAPDFSDATLSRVAGSLEGHDLSVSWLRPVPPIEHVNAKLSLLSPDAMEIVVSGGRQAGGGIAIQSGRIALSGLSAKDQFADIETQLAGPVADVLRLLRHPRIRLLDRSPVKLQDASGEIAGKLTVTHLPLRDSVTMDDVAIRAAATLSHLHVAGLAAGHDIDRGAVSLDASPDGLRVAGTAEVSGVPAQLQFDMDFRAGPPSQITQRIAATASVNQTQLASFGLDPHGVLAGPAALTANVSLRRDGQGEARLQADLARAALAVTALAYNKPAGQPATLDTHILLDGGRISAIDRLHLEGSALRLDADARFAGGRPDSIHLQRVVLGDRIDAQGEVRPPRAPGERWVASLRGPLIDVAAQLARPPAAAEPEAAPDTGPAYTIDAQFDRVRLGPGRQLGAVALHAESDGTLLQQATLSGQTSENNPFRASIQPQGHGRGLSGSAADAGALLRALDIAGTMLGGKLALTGTFDDSKPDHLLTGTLEIDAFRIRNAPVLARLLQAMTLYGLVELTRGPGLGFTRLQAPFHYAADQLDLIDARAYSSSLGMTARGRIDLARNGVDLRGTIIPAYLFNSLLGDIPLVGQLFSPERGGGLLAATYAVRGGLDDPTVDVNPLAALTPGVLRKLFGLFGTPPPPPQ